MTDESASQRLDIVVIGASGDLARRKIFPALFALYCQGFLPAAFQVFGFSRSRLSDAEFRERLSGSLTCRYAPGESCELRMAEFLSRCFYVSGSYDSVDSYLDLYAAMGASSAGGDINRLYYMAIPPSLLASVAQALGSAGLVNCNEDEPWSRVVIEKPFGHDRASSDQLSRELALVFSEPQVYRIDHYLGKEVVQNLMVLRFANRLFEPLWERSHIESVHIDWKEDIGVEGRGGYFDSYGIIRDVLQNHLLQILSLIAMEPPESLSAARIRQEKVRVLRAIQPPTREDVLIGQYASANINGLRLPGYRDDPTVPAESITPTFAAFNLKVANERWKGVPFVISAGKALGSRLTEIRIRFRQASSPIFCREAACREPNELVIQVQPNEAIYLRIVSKVPGLQMAVEPRNLDLQYKTAFSQIIPDAYESLLLDALRGERSLFIGEEELSAAWDIFTPVLHDLDRLRLEPEPYAFGSQGPGTLTEWTARQLKQ